MLQEHSAESNRAFASDWQAGKALLLAKPTIWQAFSIGLSTHKLSLQLGPPLDYPSNQSPCFSSPQ